MDAKEFATRVVTDDAFMLEIFKELPHEVFTDDAKEEDFMQAMANAAATRGWELSPADLKEHYGAAIKDLGFFGIIKFLRRFSRVSKEAGRSKKDIRKYEEQQKAELQA